MGTIVVTGAAGGIGVATCARLAADGHEVIGIDVAGSDIDADLATEDGRRAAIDGATARCGGTLDGLVTLAGLAGVTGRPGALLVAVNYFGTVELLTALRGALSSGESPAAVAISSNSTTCQPGVPSELVEACLSGDETAAGEAGARAGPLAAYPATKTALARWVRRHATTPEWIGAGITLNAVAPGFTATPMTEEVRRDPTIGSALDSFPIPVGRPGRPEEIAGVIAFLLGPDARFFCGSVVFADGGSDALIRPDDWPASL
jgi:NAD(P)-dependent dehydrogenase (short-subunit alcohol dehydrogenase family)